VSGEIVGNVDGGTGALVQHGGPLEVFRWDVW
jgi:hypothetical protein